MPDQVAIALYQLERRDLQQRMHNDNQRIIELNHLIYQLQHAKEPSNGT